MKELKMPTNRNFGIVFFILFALIGLWPLFNSQNPRYWSLIISFIFLILGLLNSRILNPLNYIWYKFGLFLGSIVSPIIMGLIFFLVVTPIGIIMRILKKDILNLKKNNKDTYWIKRKESKTSMKKQF
jgi:predicted membrane protein